MAFYDYYYSHLAYKTASATSPVNIKPLRYLMNTVNDSSNETWAVEGVRFTTDNGFLLSSNGFNFSVSKNVTAQIDNNKVVLTGLYTITNYGTKDITIKAVGLMIYDYPRPDSTGNDWTALESTTLDNPVVIPANGGTGQVTYTITVNYKPTA